MSLDGNEGSADPTTNKVVLLGDEGVGKTSLFMRFKYGKFPETTTSTQYQAEHYKEWTVNGIPVKMTLYDTAGMERYGSTIPPTYFRHARAVIVVYSFDSSESIGSVGNWRDNFSVHRIGDSHEKLKVLLVGNKVDLPEREVSARQISQTAEYCEIPESQLYEISAKDGTDFDELFDSLALAISTSPRERRKTIRAAAPDECGDVKKGNICARCTKL